MHYIIKIFQNICYICCPPRLYRRQPLYSSYIYCFLNDFAPHVSRDVFRQSENLLSADKVILHACHLLPDMVSAKASMQALFPPFHNDNIQIQHPICHLSSTHIQHKYHRSHQHVRI